MIKPDLFILGAPKCGTTALSEYLRSHPEILISHPKEPHFFATDIPGYKGKRSQAEYLALFDTDENGIKRYGEASVYYLYSEDAVKNIFSFNKDAKLIVMLRNPIKLLHSLHSQLLYSRNENVRSFEKAWSMQKMRRNGFKIPPHCTDSKILQYGDLGKLGNQVGRLFKSPFHKDQILFIFFEDFIKDTKKEYEKVLSFLNIDSDNKIIFPVVNANTKHRISWLGGFYINTPPYLTNLVKLCKRITGVKQFNISKAISKFNTKTTPRPSMSAELTQTLRQYYENDILKLSNLLSRDLTHWLS